MATTLREAVRLDDTPWNETSGRQRFRIVCVLSGMIAALMFALPVAFLFRRPRSEIRLPSPHGRRER